MVGGPQPVGFLASAGQTALEIVPDPHGPTGSRRLVTGETAVRHRDGGFALTGARPTIDGFPAPLDEVRDAILREDAILDARVRHEDDALAAFLVLARQPHDPAHHRDGWRALYDETYSASFAQADEMFAGWNDSATGAPIPPDDMRRWVEATTERIAALMAGSAPAQVLEVGCGTGLLLTRPAPSAARYLGTDISRVAIDRLTRLKAERADLARVELAVGAASEIDAPDGSFDVVVMNSVAQYLAHADDLAASLAEALRVLRPGGALFLGDIRSRPLLPILHHAALTEAATRGVGAPPDEDRVAAAVTEEVELTIDPALFADLARHPLVASCETLPKTGGYDNELSRFRYDAVVRRVSPSNVSSRLAIASRTFGAEPAERAAFQVVARQGAHVAIRAIDARVAPHAAAFGATDDTDAACGAATADELLALANGAPTAWEGAGTGRLTLHANPRFEPLAMDDRAGSVHFEAHVNAPRRRADRSAVAASVRARLGATLADHMIPRRIVLLDAWPLTASGAIDEQRLPTEHAARARSADDDGDVATILDAFCEVLGRPVGPDDDFFRSGGHSLLAIRVIASLRERMAVDLPIGVLWQNPSARALAPWIVAARGLALSPRQRRSAVLSGPAPRNLFVFPPALGFAAAYARLAEHLEGIGVVAFTAPDGMDAIASDVDTICEIQTDGPVWLLGHSSGGYLAFLAARALEARGREVAGIIALDSYWATMPSSDTSDQEIRENVARFVNRAGREEIAAVFATSQHLRESAFRQTIDYFRFLMDPALDTTTPVRAPVHLILAQGNHDRSEDWSVRSAGCTTHRGAGAHAFMVDAPHVTTNAGLIAGIIGSITIGDVP